MKKLFKLLSAIMILTMAGSSYAQVFGVKAGYNFSTQSMTSDDGSPSGIGFKPGFNIGAIAELKLTDREFFEFGLKLTTKGYKVDDRYSKYTASINYIELPINSVYKFGKGTTKFLLNAGFYAGYAISGKYKAEDEEESINFGGDKEDDDMKAFDLGFTAGLGVEIKNISICLDIEDGLINLSTYTDNGTKVKNLTAGLTIGYKFGRK